MTRTTDGVGDEALTREQVIERNLQVVEAHFHNETPDTIQEAIALYADDILWEGPARGLVLDNADDALAGYHDIFGSLVIHKHTHLRRFATEEFVFDDCLYEATYVADHMTNFPLPVGTRVSLRLAHVFEMREGRIAREIAYEIIREVGGPTDHDDIPPGSAVTTFP